MSEDAGQEYARRMLAAQHAMQTGVKLEMAGINPRATDPKHLRVGVNSAMIENAVMGKLLISKGVITELEYLKAMAEGYEAEAADYERRLGVKLG